MHLLRHARRAAVLRSAWTLLPFVAFACEPQAGGQRGTAVELADSAVLPSRPHGDERAVFGSVMYSEKPDASLGDSAPPVDLPPEAGVRDLAEEACPVRHCLINDRCYPQGSPNPFNECQWCDPARARHHWSALADGAYCDDGLWCTTADRCKLGFCTGERQCEDHEACSEFDRACLPR